MATSREERMQQRLRGAHSHQVADESFGFILPVAEEPEPPPSEPPTIRSTPNTSAKRRRLNADAPGSRTQRTSSATRSSTRQQPSNPDPDEPKDTSNEPKAAPPSAPASDEAPAQVNDADTLEALPESGSRRRSNSSRRRSSGTGATRVVTEEIANSPADAPGSGRRRRVVRISDVVTSSGARLQDVLRSPTDDLTMTTSSPLARKTRNSDAASSARTARAARRSTQSAEDGPSESSPALQDSPARQSISSMRSTRMQTGSSIQSAKDDTDELSPQAARLSTESLPSSARTTRTRSRLSGQSVEEGDETSTQSAKQIKPLTNTQTPTGARSSRGTEPVDGGRNESPSHAAQPQKDSARKPTRSARKKATGSPAIAVQEQVVEPSPDRVQRPRRGRPPKQPTDVPQPAPSPVESQPGRISSKEPAGDNAEDADEEPPDEARLPRKGRPTKRAAKDVQAAASTKPSKAPPSRDKDAGSKDAEVAQPLDDAEAAGRIGRKRPRTSPNAASPEAEVPGVLEQPAKKRRHPRQQESPAQQQQQPKGSKKKAKKRQAQGTKADGDNFTIKVQRFTKRMHYNEDDSDADILNAEIPYASRSGVNSIDVLSEMCEGIIETNLHSISEQGAASEDVPTRREYRTMLRALEAFQEELRTRLLGHAIAVDALYSLKKRVRAAQKQKLSLREDIMRIRAERDQVALRMDATRAKHEEDKKRALYQINLSSAMHDIDLAVEKGQSAPDISPEEEKVAEMQNLELLVRQISDQACSKGDTGGNLRQIKEFNAFLERAAEALEGR